MRKIRVFSAGPEPVYISLDYRAQEGYVYRLAHSDEPESSLFKKLLSAKDSAIVSEFAGRKIVREPVPIAKEEPLRLELAHFVACVQERRTPKVTGEQARAALEVAFEVTRQVRESLSSIPRGESGAPVPPPGGRLPRAIRNGPPPRHAGSPAPESGPTTSPS
jgi:hypothetical protein